MEFDHYEVVPSHITAEIIAARQKDLAAKKEE
jgi:translation elongation factor EF-G